MSSDSVHRDAANLFGCGITTVFRVARRIVDWLLIIMPDHIIWPRGDAIQNISAAFAVKAGIENCIGAIDGSHIFVEKPINYGRVYYCRKDRYSIVLQGVVDANLLFTNVHCGDPGSYHDTRVLRRSELYTTAENNLANLFPNQTFLLGDKGYVGVGKKWIVTPFKDYGNLTAEQTDFNVRVSSSRVVVEHAFGRLKCRFRYIKSIMRLRDIHFAARLVVACCVLHNICIRGGDAGEDLIEEELNDENGNDNNENLEMNEDEDSDNSDADEEVPDANVRMRSLFRQLYPGAVIAPIRRNNRV